MTAEPPVIVQGYIERGRWVAAKTMPENPHEYVVLPKDPGPEREAFRALVRWVQAGTDRRWHGRKYRTSSWGGWDCWVMDARPILVNRKPTGHAGWDDEEPGGQSGQPEQVSEGASGQSGQPRLWLSESDHWGVDPDTGVVP
jgi:hypothetical protein